MYEVLTQQVSDFDCIVPVPLSPDKQKKGQPNRTRILAQALGALLRITVADVLSLSGAISKRQFLSAALTQAQFEHQYRQLLNVDTSIRRYPRILLLDDVCTEGSTLNSALQRIRETHPQSQLSATTAGQMILKSVVKDERLILGETPPMLFTDVGR
jgi:predicted amidophosphoribosyltransferase